MSENKNTIRIMLFKFRIKENKPTIFTSRRVTLKTLETKGINNLKIKLYKI